MIYNHTRRNVVCQEVEQAFTFFTRLRGLMFRNKLAATQGLLLAPCSSIHMFFMRFAIDVVFLDRRLRVVGIEQGLKPWRLSTVYPEAYYALELAAGRAQEAGVRVGDVLELVSE